MLTIAFMLLLAGTEASQASTAPPALDYDAAKALADRDEAALPKLAADAMRASQSGVLSRAADACRSDEKPAPFTVVLELDAQGKPTRHWRNADTGLARCMEDKLARAAFYIPAKAPFFVSFEVSFTP
jgi:hypothetical protein